MIPVDSDVHSSSFSGVLVRVSDDPKSVFVNYQANNGEPEWHKCSVPKREGRGLSSVDLHSVRGSAEVVVLKGSKIDTQGQNGIYLEIREEQRPTSSGAYLKTSEMHRIITDYKKSNVFFAGGCALLTGTALKEPLINEG